jgi:phosphoglycerol transferase MdoB-like AlkP superfamily enzyme
MSALNIKYFNSLPKVFKDNGYQNRYFTSGNENFDNVGVFLRQNDIPDITSGKDYDPKFIQSSFGVPDHVLFDYVLEGLDKEEGPFFSTVMTISDHGPYIIPPEISFEPKQANIKKQIVEYADWSLSQFMEQAKTKDWYENTVFVFVADHGVVMGDITYEIPFSLHHIPLLIYSPDTSFIKPQKINNYGTQMDVLPTVAGLLNFTYTNNTFGIDLLSEKRKYGVLSSDDKFGCLDDEFYYIYRKSGKETLHRYNDKNPDDVIKDYPEKALEMKNHVISIMQSTKWMITHNKTK